MKKSEFIEKIYKKVNSIDKIQIEAVLDLAEFFGMAPIINKEKSWQIKENGEQTYEVREWEEE